NRHRATARVRVCRNATTSYRPITPTLATVIAAAIVSHAQLIVRIAAAMSRGCTWRSVCQVSATTAPITIAGTNRDAWPISHTTAVFRLEPMSRAGSSVTDAVEPARRG